MTSPIRRPKWQHGVTDVIQTAGAVGRRGVGTVNHCMPGKETIVEEVMDWQPYDHVTDRSLLPIPNAPKLLNTYALTDVGDGRTRIEMRFGTPRSAKDRAIAMSLMQMITDGLAHLVPIVEAAAREAEAAAPGEPEVPESHGREPIDRAREIAAEARSDDAVDRGSARSSFR
ncbi:MAG: hypothetical protein H0U52_16090 [Chloroflexi bacterium]|nr:hypothetical protein [Chloroflexota bacterium]